MEFAMRLKFALAGLAAFGFSSFAAAETVTLSPVSFSPEFQTELDEDYGAREGAYLSAAVTRAVSDALARRGATVDAGAPVTLELAIVDASPNRPTMEQLSQRPGLDYFRSISIGGAELRAVLRGADGAVLQEVTHERRNHALSDLTGGESTWSEANRAIRQFANKVADAYVARSQ